MFGGNSPCSLALTISSSFLESHSFASGQGDTTGILYPSVSPVKKKKIDLDFLISQGLKLHLVNMYNFLFDQVDFGEHQSRYSHDNTSMCP